MGTSGLVTWDSKAHLHSGGMDSGLNYKLGDLGTWRIGLGWDLVTCNCALFNTRRQFALQDVRW